MAGLQIPMSDAPDAGPSRSQDLIGGLLSIAFGLFALVTASSYPMGSLLRMGPGFFPSVLAVLITLLGLALVASALRPRPAGFAVQIRFRPIISIGCGIVVFALLLERTGLIPATLALVVVSSLAERRWRPQRAITLALAMAALVYVVFIGILQTPIAVVRF